MIGSHFDSPSLYDPNSPSAPGAQPSFVLPRPSKGEGYALSFPTMMRRGEKRGSWVGLGRGLCLGNVNANDRGTLRACRLVSRRLVLGRRGRRCKGRH